MLSLEFVFPVRLIEMISFRSLNDVQGFEYRVKNIKKAMKAGRMPFEQGCVSRWEHVLFFWGFRKVRDIDCY